MCGSIGIVTFEATGKLVWQGRGEHAESLFVYRMLIFKGYQKFEPSFKNFGGGGPMTALPLPL